MTKAQMMCCPMAGAETHENELIELIRGPENLDGSPLVAFNRFEDDSTYFDEHDANTTSEDTPPRVLDPFRSLGTLNLGRLSEVFHQPALTEDTRNPIEVVINRV